MDGLPEGGDRTIVTEQSIAEHKNASESAAQEGRAEPRRSGGQKAGMLANSSPYETGAAAPELQLIGECLQTRGLITAKDCQQALAMQAEVGGLLGQALLRLGAVTEEELLATLSAQLDLPIADVVMLPVDLSAYLEGASLLGLPPQWFVANQAFAWLEEELALEGDPAHSSDHDTDQNEAPISRSVVVNILGVNPIDLKLRETLDSVFLRKQRGDDEAGLPAISEIRYFLAPNQTVDMCLARLQQQDNDTDGDEALTDTSRLREMAEEAPVIDFVNNLFAVALKDNASDIHIEAFEHAFVVRYRIDGVLHTRQNQSRAQFDAIASRIKLIAGMDIAERRLPQDGRHTIRFAGNDIDLRVSSVPSTWGESLVMRLLRKQTELPDLSGLGLTGRAGVILDEILAMPNGVFLVTGPTGSGKSTTLYRSLEKINDGYRKIITIEDPVEYDINGITQIQVKPDIGYDFASGLRAILRQDPDVIMVGEIRDGETATIAAQASLTGHFVLSTLHTNSSLAAITRLEDIGLERFLISAAVRGLMAQRLVRRLCDHCAEPVAGDPGKEAFEQARRNGADFGDEFNNEGQWRAAKGCEACDHTGYRGRVAVFEVAKIDEDLRDGIIRGAALSEIFAIARKQGFLTLMEDGLLKARAGLTTMEEVRRVCGGDAG